MQLSVPIHYQIAGVRVGNRAVRRYHFREYVSVTIREVNSSDAPVAVSWAPPPYRRNSEQTAGISGPDGVQMTRWFEDHHWQRLCLAHISKECRMNGPLLDGQTLEKSLLDWQGQRLLNIRWDGRELRPKTLANGDPRMDFSEIEDDGRDSAIEEMEAAFERLVSVDGVLHQRCREPFLVLSGNPQQGSVSVEISEYLLFSEPTSRMAIKPLSEWEHASAKFEGRGDGKRGRDQVKVNGPRIALPESLAYDWDIAFRVSFLMNRLMNSLHSRGIGYGPEIKKAMLSQDPEEQYDLIQSLPHGSAMIWASHGVDTSCIGAALTILDNRAITLEPARAKPGM